MIGTFMKLFCDQRIATFQNSSEFAEKIYGNKYHQKTICRLLDSLHKTDDHL